MVNSNHDDGQPVAPRTVEQHEDTNERQIIKYSDGTVRTDFRAEGLNDFLGSARERGGDDEVGEPYEPEKSKEARTSHPNGWVRFSDYH